MRGTAGGDGALLIVNPTATTTRPALRDLIIAALSGTVSLEVALTRGRGHATELAADARARGLRSVISLGGDGTANEVVQALAGSDVALGVVPGGGANVLVRALGLPSDPVAATACLLRALRADRTRRIGRGLAEPSTSGARLFTCNAGMGFDARVVARVERRPASKQLLRQFSYVVGALDSWRTVRRDEDPLRVTVTTADRPAGQDAALGAWPIVLVGNSSPYTVLGDRELIAHPGASFDRGLDLLLVSGPTIGRLLTVLAGALAGGRHVRLAGVRHLSDIDRAVLAADRPLPVHVDGDPLPATSRLVLSAVPDALAVHV